MYSHTIRYRPIAFPKVGNVVLPFIIELGLLVNFSSSVCIFLSFCFFRFFIFLLFIGSSFQMVLFFFFIHFSLGSGGGKRGCVCARARVCSFFPFFHFYSSSSFSFLVSIIFYYESFHIFITERWVFEKGWEGIELSWRSNEILIYVRYVTPMVDD